MIKAASVWLSVCLLFAVSTGAVAQDMRDALQACAAEKNDAKRLACYDGVVGRKVEQASVTKPSPRVETPTPPPMKPVTPSARSVASSANANAESNFGLSAEQMQKSTSAAPAKQVISRVAKVETRARGRLIVTFENDQVWEQLSPDPAFSLQVGDPVTVKSGALGAFYLVGRYSRTTNVRRLR